MGMLKTLLILLSYKALYAKHPTADSSKLAVKSENQIVIAGKRLRKA